MKNKATLYLLVVIVLGIWGVIGYKLIVAFSGKGGQKNLQNELSSNQIVLSSIEKPSFSITPPERDPFLGGLYVKKTIKKKPTKRKPQIQLQWPDIVFKGLVSDKGAKKRVFLIDVNGESHFTEIGEMINTKLRLVKGDNQKVKIALEKEKKVFELKDNAFSY